MNLLFANVNQLSQKLSTTKFKNMNVNDNIMIISN